jgi:hypothetical protein
MTELLEKDKKFKWMPSYEAIFHELRNGLTPAPVFVMPNI